MSVFKRKSGRYAVLIDLMPTTLGKRRRRSLGTFATKAEAQKAERSALLERDRGIDIEPGSVTVKALIARFVAAASPNWSPITAHRTRDILDRYILPHLGEIKLERLAPAHVADWIALLRNEGGSGGRALSPKSVHHAYAVLRQALGWAVRMQLSYRNVAVAIDPPRVPRHEATAYSSEDVAAILRFAAGHRLENVIRLALLTGARRGELLALRWTDVDAEEQQLMIRVALSEVAGKVTEKTPKSGRSRRIPLSGEALAALRSERARQAQDKLTAGSAYSDSGHIFQSAIGGLLRPLSVTDGFRKIARRAKVHSTSFHTLRHTCATWMLSSGVDVRNTAGILGHSNASTTLGIYAHVVPSAQNEAVQTVGRLMRTAQGGS